MSYLNFDKTLLINLERSLGKEMIRTNRAGAYNSTTLVDCNTRKYHGQLVLPLGDPLPEGNYVLLSSLDETVIQHGAEFNLGIHRYDENLYLPNGHKYIREFDCEVISKTTYRVGGVILTKERMLVSFEPRVLIRYTLVEAHSPTILRLKPFLAFRNTNELTHENSMASSDVREVQNGRVARMYESFPELYMQCSKKVDYTHAPAWYKGIEYMKEQERGFSYKEDQLVPGWFEMPIKKGESVIFSAGISEVNPKSLKSLWDKELQRRWARDTMFNTLKNSASQFYKREGDKCYLLAGYPWFKASAREEFIAMSGCTMGIGRPEYWDAIVNKTAVDEVRGFMAGKVGKLVGMDEPDVLLWFIRALQEYANYTSIDETAKLYGDLIVDVVNFIRKQHHPRLLLHNNGLVWVDGKTRPATWMNALEDGRPITPRTGYVVEINALWYNALHFTADIHRSMGKDHFADLMEYQAEITKDSFVQTFWNGVYLDDYVDGDYHNKEVRPNQIIAASLPYSPLDRFQRKAVVDICTKELYTPKGLRTISPKSGGYRPVYIGGQLERDRNFHNGPVWPWTISAYAAAYLRVYQRSGESFIRRLLTGFEAEMSELCIGTLNELYDGNPPFKGHGGMSYAPSVSAVIEVCNTLESLVVKE
jgi:predicted glycogen debranching enzyme